MTAERQVAAVKKKEVTATEPMYLHLSIADLEVVQTLTEIGESRERQELALTSLRIGNLSLRAARGTVDGATVCSEGARLLVTLEERLSSHRQVLDEALGGTLRAYFDQSSGSFTERVQRLLHKDGELAGLIGGQVDAARQSLDTLFQQHLGEDSELRRLLSREQGNDFMAALHALLTQALQRQGEAITAEFTLDRPESALSRLARELKDRHGDLERNLGEKVASVVSEFSLDDENSALSRLVGRVESAQSQISAQFSLDSPDSGLTRIVQRIESLELAQTERSREFELRVTGILEKLVIRRDESRRGTQHGNGFEARVGERLQASCIDGDDVLDAVGATTGTVPRSKVGDFVVTLGPDSATPGAAVVVEAKAREGMTLKATLEEADKARRNRGASVCLFVHAARTAPAGLPELLRWGSDIVVIWDDDNATTNIHLKAAYQAAKALAVRASRDDEEEAASLAEMDAAIEAIRKQITGFEEVQTFQSPR